MNQHPTARLLREFYGLSPVDKAKEARDIDSREFQPRMFFEESIARDSLQQLLARENSLVSDIRAFENDLQTLVYNNYNKFLGASDIVRSLSTNISSLTTQMNCLQSGLTNVATHTDEITSELDENRQKIQRLTGISRLLDRVQYISQLPAKLRLCLQYGQYKTAVGVWNKVESILLNQRHYKSFEAIHGECSAIMEEIKDRIRGQMLNTDISVNDSVEYAKLLINLKSPVGIVCSQLAHHRFLVIDNALEECENKGSIPVDPFAALQTLKAVAVDDSDQFITLFQTQFSNSLPNDSILTDFMEKIFSRVSELLPTKTLFSLDCKSLASYLQDFTKLSKKITTHQQISRYLHDTLQSYTKARAAIVYTRIYQLVNPDISETVSTPNRELDEKTDEKTDENDGIANSTKTPEKIENGKSKGSQISEKSPSEIEERNFTHEAIQIFSEVTSRLIDEFQDLVLMDYHDCAAFLTAELSNITLRQLFDLFENAPPEATLGAALTAQALALREIPNLFNDLAKLGSELPLQGLQERLASDARTVSLSALRRFVAFKRSRLDSFISANLAEKATNSGKVANSEKVAKTQDSADDARESDREPSRWVQLLLEGLFRLDEELKSILSTADSSYRYQNTYGLSSTAPSFYGVRDTGSFHQIVERMFTNVNRLHLGSAPKFEAQSILTSITMYSLKTVLELCRQMNFTNEEFNQAQFDGYCLYVELCRKMEQPDVFAALAEEIVSSVADRTLDPVPLPTDVLKRDFNKWHSKTNPSL